jgi:hypothetical protein
MHSPLETSVVDGTMPPISNGSAGAFTLYCVLQKVIRRFPLQQKTDYRMDTGISQKPLMHWAVESQQSFAVVHTSSRFEQRGGPPHVPFVHRPLQQSTPLEQLAPSCRHGSRAVKARWLPVPGSCPAK